MRVYDPELVVHVFAPLTGERAEEAYAEARRVWLGCRLLLGMAHPVPQLPQHLPASLTDLPGNAAHEIPLAAQERIGADFQAVARRVGDVLNLSVILSPRDPHRQDWSELINRWVTVSAPWPAGLLTGGHLYQAKIEDGTPAGLDAATARTLAGGLPVNLPDGWWDEGVPVGNDLVCYEPSEPGGLRSLLVLAAADRSTELNAWTWSDGGSDLPPAGHLLRRPVVAPPAPAPVSAPAPEPAAPPVTDLSRRVLVCTSDQQVRDRLHAFLRLIDLKPVERNECIEATRKTMPTTRDVMLAGLQLAQATIVVMTPEDGTRQPSQDLVLEAGLAMALAERQTVLLVAGNPVLPAGMRDGGIALDDRPETKASIVRHLTLAGCEPDSSGTAWLAPGPFLGLTAYTRP